MRQAPARTMPHSLSFMLLPSALPRQGLQRCSSLSHAPVVIVRWYLLRQPYQLLIPNLYREPLWSCNDTLAARYRVAIMLGLSVCQSCCRVALRDRAGAPRGFTTTFSIAHCSGSISATNIQDCKRPGSIKCVTNPLGLSSWCASSPPFICRHMKRVGSRAEVSAKGGERKYSPTHKCLQVTSMRELPSPYFVISGSACWHALYLLHAPPRSPHFVVPHFACASCSMRQSLPMDKSNCGQSCEASRIPMASPCHAKCMRTPFRRTHSMECGPRHVRICRVVVCLV